MHFHSVLVCALVVVSLATGITLFPRSGSCEPVSPAIAAAALVPVSPKDAWTISPPTQVNEGTAIWRDIVMWIPNRFLDLIDVFRIDVGVGPSFGGVVRVTKYGQVGFRQVMPASLRVGDFGREMPVLLETSNEFGVGPLYADSADRKVCIGELGLGADAIVAGAYAGVCVDELVDFVAGIFFIDLKDDDL